uniref:BLUF domain-containing protein n=1 Tax=Magnetococcus massalia (strain MO-1) TaxID=451514 RepID=A0A1S7LIF2_MAGMO|nr:conserved protein of unknown function [Candidatus Magnetococcus massalia]
MDKKQCRLVYISRPSPLAPGDLGNILAVSQRNNAKLEITGALMFNKDFFFQVLEGPLDAVNQLYAKIEKDPLHHDCFMILQELIAFRQFGDWSMAYIPEEKISNALISEFGLNRYDTIKNLPHNKLAQLLDTLAGVDIRHTP